MGNSGSTIAASQITNVNEYVHRIKEGEVKNYIWSEGTSSWVRDPGTVVNLSGVEIAVDISGDWVDMGARLRQVLSAHQVRETAIADLLDILEQCERYRYAPAVTDL